MIQTQLLRLEPPYQIVNYDYEAALHVATLIVTQEVTDDEGKTTLQTRCHPVVNYSSKHFFTDNPERLAKHLLSVGEDIDDDTPVARPYSEGTIWDQVDVSDVEVLGVDGVTKELEWWVPATLVAYSNDVDDFRKKLRRLLSCLLNLGVFVKSYTRDAFIYVDCYQAYGDRLFTDVYIEKHLIYSARVESVESVKDEWVKVGQVIHDLILSRTAEITIDIAPWVKDDALGKLASEANFALWDSRNKRSDGKKVQD